MKLSERLGAVEADVVTPAPKPPADAPTPMIGNFCTLGRIGK